MEQEQIIQGNKLIAEFVRTAEKQYSDDGDFIDSQYCNDNSSEANYYRWGDMRFSTSWDWIMPVVKKIQQIELSDFPKKKAIMNALLDVEIESLYLAVVIFAQWYNEAF